MTQAGKPSFRLQRDSPRQPAWVGDFIGTDKCSSA